MQTINYQDFKQQLEETLDQIISTNAVVSVHLDANAGVVLLSLAEYRAFLETLHLLNSCNNQIRLTEALQRAESSSYQAHDLIEPQ